ncbi:MAG TPA: hypothetical protein GXZ36_02125 [Firmicutes bacterium]|nr:hypothetical protein [Bacillota bacterium]
MGTSSIELFNTQRIRVITGASGEVGAVSADYTNGRLQTFGSTCSH